MKPIPFTQFLLPDGREKTITIGRPDAIADMAFELLSSGCRLEAEVLSTGEISLAVENGDMTLAIEIVANGPAVVEAVDKIICDAHRFLRSISEQKILNE